MDRELPSSKRSSTRLKKKTTSNKFIQKLEISNRELPSKSTPKNRPGQSKRSKVNLLDTPKYFDSDEYTETNPPAIDLDIIKNPKLPKLPRNSRFQKNKCTGPDEDVVGLNEKSVLLKTLNNTNLLGTDCNTSEYLEISLESSKLPPKEEVETDQRLTPDDDVSNSIRSVNLASRHIHIICIHVALLLRMQWINLPLIQAICLSQVPPHIHRQLQSIIAEISNSKVPLNPHNNTKTTHEKTSSIFDFKNEKEELHIDSPSSDDSEKSSIELLRRSLSMLARWWHNHWVRIPFPRNLANYSYKKGNINYVNKHRNSMKKFLRCLIERKGDDLASAALFAATLRAFGIESRLVHSMQPMYSGIFKQDVANSFESEKLSSPLFWCEARLESGLLKDEQFLSWIVVDCIGGLVGERFALIPGTKTFNLLVPNELSSHRQNTIIAAYTSASKIKMIDRAVDVTRRYTTPSIYYSTKSIKARKRDKPAMDCIFVKPDPWEDFQMQQLVGTEPLPTSRAGFASSSTYILESQLPKYFVFAPTEVPRSYEFETYSKNKLEADDSPLISFSNSSKFGCKSKKKTLIEEKCEKLKESPGSGIIGTFREENIRLRADLRHVRSKEAWYLQHARIVRESETPAKTVVLPVIKRSKKKLEDEADVFASMISNEKQTKLQPLYGEWQTDPFDPPLVIDGKIPKNKFGNIDLYVPDKMLPKGCTWMAIQEAAGAARDLDIDYAVACVGMTFRGGAAVPNLYGIVVCEEFVPIITQKIREKRILILAEKAEAEAKLARKKQKVLRGLLSSGSLPQNYDLIFNPATSINSATPDQQEHCSGDRFDPTSLIITSSLAKNNSAEFSSSHLPIDDGFETLFRETS